MSDFEIETLMNTSLINRETANERDPPRAKVKVGFICPVQQPRSYWDRFSALPIVGVEPTQR